LLFFCTYALCTVDRVMRRCHHERV
jgi:hypothetical protein